VRAEVARQTAEVFELLQTMLAEYEFLERKGLSTEAWENQLTRIPEGQVVMLAATVDE
jgi:hypothetical protein